MKTALLFLLLSSFTSSNDVSSVLQKVNGFYANTNELEFDLSYELLKGTNEIIDTKYEGHVYKLNDQVYQKIKNTEFIYLKDLSLRVNSEQKTMELLKSQTAVLTGFDLEYVLKNLKSKSVEEDGNEFILNLEIGNTSLGIKKIRLAVDAKKYHVNEMTLHYSVLQDFSKKASKKEMDIARLRIKFSNYQRNPKDRSELFEASSYYKNEQNGALPVGKYLGYKLFDLRT